MSVMIKGMKMPNNCTICRFCVPEAEPGDGEMCMATGRFMPPCSTERLEECPLVELPTPHGRLIDGIDLLKAITENAYIIHHGYNEVEYGMSCFGIMQAISEAPTIIEAEEGEPDVSDD